MVNEFQSEHPLLFWFVLIIAFLVYCGFLSFLQRMLNKVEHDNRDIHPMSVWLMLVPVGNIFYQFFLISGMANSIQAEFKRRGTEFREERPGYDLGLLMCLFNCAGLLAYYSKVFALIPLVFWIAYWAKMAYFDKMLSRPRPVKNYQSAAKTESSGDLELFRDKLE